MNTNDNDNTAEIQARFVPHTPPRCPACGGAARRSSARFCATCGRKLGCAEYYPVDQLRASYHLPRPSHVSQTDSPSYNKQIAGLFASVDSRQNRNNASTMAATLVAYALVPFFGTVFCLCVVVMGVVGLHAAARTPHVGGRLTSSLSIVVGLLTLCLQLLLWWSTLRILNLQF